MLGHAVESVGLEKRHPLAKPCEELLVHLKRVSQFQRLLDASKLLFERCILTLMHVDVAHHVDHKAPLERLLLLLLLPILSHRLVQHVACGPTRLEQPPVPECIQRLQRALRDGQGCLFREAGWLGGEDAERTEGPKGLSFEHLCAERDGRVQGEGRL